MTSDEEYVRGVLDRVDEFEVEARAILGTHEAATDRLITLENSYSRLSGLSLAQDELFRESLRALESGFFRAAHVLGWAGFIDWLHNHLANEHLANVTAKRPRWDVQTAEDFRHYSDFQVIEVGKEAGAYRAATMRSLHGWLDTRNACAHPSDFFPDLNMTLGYIATLIDRIERFQKS